MFRFIKKIFVSAMMFFVCNVSGVNSLNAILLNATAKCISMNNKECKIRSEIININSNEPLFYPYSIKVNKCSGSCKNINYPYSKYAVLMLLKTRMLKYSI